MDLEKLKALCEAATPGPWAHEENDGEVWWGVDPEHAEINVCDCLSSNRRQRNIANADFIAAARTAVPELIARVEELEGAILRAEDSGRDGYGHERCPWCLSNHEHDTDCIVLTCIHPDRSVEALEDDEDDQQR